jgi:hypothetical protein
MSFNLQVNSCAQDKGWRAVGERLLEKGEIVLRHGASIASSFHSRLRREKIKTPARLPNAPILPFIDVITPARWPCPAVTVAKPQKPQPTEKRETELSNR